MEKGRESVDPEERRCTEADDRQYAYKGWYTANALRTYVQQLEEAIAS